MKDLKDTYQGPPKYLSQRDAPLDIPVEVVEKLFMAIDVDLDDRVSIEELQGYVKLSEVTLERMLLTKCFWRLRRIELLSMWPKSIKVLRLKRFNMLSEVDSLLTIGQTNGMSRIDHVVTTGSSYF